jgi:hypothetical protein
VVLLFLELGVGVTSVSSYALGFAIMRVEGSQ